MQRKGKYVHDQLVMRRQSLCWISMEDDRITLTFDKVFPKVVSKVAARMEEEMICPSTETRGKTIWMAWPDSWICLGIEDLKAAVQEMFEEENYEIIYK